MLDHLLEEPCEDLSQSVWENTRLKKEYEERVVKHLICQSWAIDEMNAGFAMDDILDNIWEGYETWAEEFLEQEQMLMIE